MAEAFFSSSWRILELRGRARTAPTGTYPPDLAGTDAQGEDYVRRQHHRDRHRFVPSCSRQGGTRCKGNRAARV